MCLIVIAHGVSDRFPLVIAANRDEFYQRPTDDAHVWKDAPHVIGGRDALHGGAWLAITTEGRFAAVTNLRGATTRGKSRGFLVRDFVLGDRSPLEYAWSIRPDEYAGFHLLVGQVHGPLAYVADEASILAPGIHALSNAPVGEHWAKEALAMEAMRNALQRDDPTEQLLAFLTTPRGTGDVEREAFVSSEKYGTRASTVIVVSREGMTFTELDPVTGRRGVLRTPVLTS